jgi:hypothetical protein
MASPSGMRAGVIGRPTALSDSMEVEFPMRTVKVTSDPDPTRGSFSPMGWDQPISKGSMKLPTGPNHQRSVR